MKNKVESYIRKYKGLFIRALRGNARKGVTSLEGVHLRDAKSKTVIILDVYPDPQSGMLYCEYEVKFRNGRKLSGEMVL